MVDSTEVNVDPEGFRELAWALGLEADGRRLQRDFSKTLRVALEPAAAEARAGILAMGSVVEHEGPSLRAAIASEVKAQTRLGGERAGAWVRVSKKMPRDFRNAPKRTNRKKGWRRPMWGRTETKDGRSQWVRQLGRPDWFDGPMEDGRPRYRIAVEKAMNDAAQRITRGR